MQQICSRTLDSIKLHIFCTQMIFKISFRSSSRRSDGAAGCIVVRCVFSLLYAWLSHWHYCRAIYAYFQISWNHTFHSVDLLCGPHSVSITVCVCVCVWFVRLTKYIYIFEDNGYWMLLLHIWQISFNPQIASRLAWGQMSVAIQVSEISWKPCEFAESVRIQKRDEEIDFFSSTLFALVFSTAIFLCRSLESTTHSLCIIFHSLCAFSASGCFFCVLVRVWVNDSRLHMLYRIRGRTASNGLLFSRICYGSD